MKATKSPSDVRHTAVGSDPKLTLRVPCVECKEALVVSLPIEHGALAYLADEHLWHLTVLSPPGQGSQAPIALGLLCPSCAVRVYPPEVLKATIEARVRRRLS